MPIKTYLFSFLLLSITSFSSLANFQALTSFGENPGALTASYFQPSKNINNIIVLLHGCAQNGELLAKQSGFLAQAKKNNFILLLPQQNNKNNVKACFNWFSDQDTAKNRGENFSIYNMTNQLKAQTHAKSIYIVGVSAGGAMVSTLLVNYPELFQSGAVIAGLPYPCANNLAQAISCMRNGPVESASVLVEQVKKQQSKMVKWPTLTVWTGDKDNIVNPKNSSVLAKQWAGLFSDSTAAKTTSHKGYRKTQWFKPNIGVVVELIEFENLGHGMMVTPKKKEGGVAAPFLLPSPLSSAKQIVDFWSVNI